MSDWPDHESMLTQFRDWLAEAQAQVDALPADLEPLAGATDVRAIGLYDLVEAFTTLRHELKLQTKSARSLEERSQSVLDAIEGALTQFRAVQPQEQQAAEQAAKPLAEALADLAEALQRGRKVIEAAQKRLLETTGTRLKSRLDQLFREQSRWQRWRSRPFYESACRLCDQQVSREQQEVFQSLLEGYGLIEKRLHRVMREEKIHPIATVGTQVDPACMTVVEVTANAGRPAGLVVEEVRPGYLWKGKVLRFAEVRAVSDAPQGPGQK